jgi:hypothetical protein
MRKSNTRATATFAKFAAMPFVIVAVGGCAADPADPQVEIIELKVENDQYAALDLDRAGVSLGDMDVYSGNAIKDGRKVGRGGGSCQVLHVDGEKITTQCVLTMELEQGSVTLQALWLKGANPLDMAVTGGTGAYQIGRASCRERV